MLAKKYQLHKSSCFIHKLLSETTYCDVWSHYLLVQGNTKGICEREKRTDGLPIYPFGWLTIQQSVKKSNSQQKEYSNIQKERK